MASILNIVLLNADSKLGNETIAYTSFSCGKMHLSLKN